MNRKWIQAVVLVAVAAFFIWQKYNEKKGGGKAPPKKPAITQGGDDRRGGDEKADELLKGTDPARAAGMAAFTLPDIPFEKRGNNTVRTFGAAKRKLPDIFKGAERTFYCGCEYTGKQVNHASCGYKVRKDAKRAARIEWEHVVPASQFGHSFRVWHQGHERCYKRRKKYKGRKCVGEVSGLFARMEADLYNLRPAIGEVNGNRSNYKIGEIPGEEREYGQCDFEVESKVAEPKASIRGDIARTYLYMDWAYPNRGILDGPTREMMLAWHKKDPPTQAERSWARRVAKVQGNINPFIPD